VVTPAGLALTAFLTRRYFPGAQGNGLATAGDPSRPEKSGALAFLQIPAGSL